MNGDLTRLELTNNQYHKKTTPNLSQVALFILRLGKILQDINSHNETLRKIDDHCSGFGLSLFHVCMIISATITTTPNFMYMLNN